MRDRYLEYRKIADTLLSRLGRTALFSLETELSKEYLATPEELAVRAAFIRALSEELGAIDKP